MPASHSWPEPSVEVALGPRRRERLFVPAIPIFLWAIWYLGWGHTAHTFVSFHNAANLPSYVLDGLASSLSVYVGLSQPFGVADSPALAWGRPLLVLVGVIAVWRVYRLWRPPVRLLTTIAVLLSYWSLTALNASIFGLPTVGRYQYPRGRRHRPGRLGAGEGRQDRAARRGRA